MNAKALFNELFGAVRGHADLSPATAAVLKSNPQAQDLYTAIEALAKAPGTINWATLLAAIEALITTLLPLLGG
jgi:hypothetical protein